MMMFGGIFGLLIIGLIVYLITGNSYVHSHHRNNRYYCNAQKGVIDILNEKYANGDITDEEYTRKKKILLG